MQEKSEKQAGFRLLSRNVFDYFTGLHTFLNITNTQVAIVACPLYRLWSTKSFSTK